MKDEQILRDLRRHLVDHLRAVAPEFIDEEGHFGWNKSTLLTRIETWRDDMLGFMFLETQIEVINQVADDCRSIILTCHE